jgi:kynureninase
MRRFVVGTPPILSMCAIEAGVDLVVEAGIPAIREKSLKGTEYLIALWREMLEPLGVSLNSPVDCGIRGSHVSFGHPNGLQIDQALIKEMNVIPDFRYPDSIRFGVTPLYTSFSELREGVVRMAEVIRERKFEHYPAEPPSVT